MRIASFDAKLLLLATCAAFLIAWPAPAGAQEDMDWGDAPDPTYPTLATNFGACHVAKGATLGRVRDSEANGQPNAAATGDDIAGTVDDEDGVLFTSPIIGGETATLEVTVSQTCLLDAWIDFNGDGGWTQASDKIFSYRPLSAGTTALSFAVPLGATAGTTAYARFRVSANGVQFPRGQASDGEVEDYLVGIGQKWEQKPDLSTTGIDVQATASFILADDFLCGVTGPITEIRVWGSWYQDKLPHGSQPGAVGFILSIHKDIPAPPQGFSKPGEVLWLKEFAPGDFTVSLDAEQIQEGWMTPPDQYTFPGDWTCWRYDFRIKPEDAFIQRGTPQRPVVYWLDLQAYPDDPDTRFGWKTSLNHWNDDAVWGSGKEPYLGPWSELRYPPKHQYMGQSIDLAFAVTGESVLGQLGLSLHKPIPDHFWWQTPTDPHNEMISLSVSATAEEAVSWQSISLVSYGLGDDAADIAAVNVWLDNDNDAVVSAADTLLGSGVYMVDDGLVTIPFAAPPVIPAGGARRALVSYTMQPSAPYGSTYTIAVTAASGIGAVSGLPVPVVLTPSPITGSKKIVGPAPVTIGEAKKLPIGEVFLLADKEITANFQSPGWPVPWHWVYIEEDDRSAGIGVNMTGLEPLSVGDRGSLLGTCVLIDSAELMVWPGGGLVTPGAPKIKPLGMTNKATGGGEFGGQPALYDQCPPWDPGAASCGLSNVGSLVRTWGRVTGRGEVRLGGGGLAKVTWIDDGSYLHDGYTDSVNVPSQGIAVVELPGPSGVMTGYWGVTGILRAIQSPGGLPVRLLVPRDINDFVQFLP